jgi:hypothetical protein
MQPRDGADLCGDQSAVHSTTQLYIPEVGRAILYRSARSRNRDLEGFPICTTQQRASADGVSSPCLQAVGSNNLCTWADFSCEVETPLDQPGEKCCSAIGSAGDNEQRNPTRFSCTIVYASASATLRLPALCARAR